MKDLYPEYYPIDFEKLWRDAVFVFDTNVLLNLYCYPEAERNDFLQALECIKDRLWLPSYVVYEYQKGRTEKIQDQHDIYLNSKKYIIALKRNIEDFIEKYRHPDTDLNIADLLQPARKALQTVLDQIQQHDVPELITAENDPIRVYLDSIYSDDKVGRRYSNGEILKLKEEWHIRKENKMPPGFNDGKPGDYIIWTQVIEYARENQKPIIFVTDDGKNDWVKDGKPLPELCGEMYQNANVDCWIYSTEHFSSEGKRRKYLTIADATIKTAAETAIREATSLDLEHLDKRELITDLVYTSSAEKLNLSSLRFAYEDSPSLSQVAAKLDDDFRQRMQELERERLAFLRASDGLIGTSLEAERERMAALRTRDRLIGTSLEAERERMAALRASDGLIKAMQEADRERMILLRANDDLSQMLEEARNKEMLVSSPLDEADALKHKAIGTFDGQSKSTNNTIIYSDQLNQSDDEDEQLTE